MIEVTIPNALAAALVRILDRESERLRACRRYPKNTTIGDVHDEIQVADEVARAVWKATTAPAQTEVGEAPASSDSGRRDASGAARDFQNARER